MNPSPKKPRPLLPRGQLAPSSAAPAEDLVVGLFSLEGASAAMALNGFDQEEFVSNLIAKVRDNDPYVSLAASNQLTRYLKDILSLSGTVQTQQITSQEQQNGRTPSAIQQRTVLAPRSPSFSSGDFHPPVPSTRHPEPAAPAAGREPPSGPAPPLVRVPLPPLGGEEPA